MAAIVPDAVPAKASQGEKKVFQLLRDELPDDFFVYYEPSVNGLYPDFIIMSPTFGLLILEIKGWRANQIESADNQFFLINQGEQIESCQSPLRQGKGYLDALLHQFKSYSILCQDDGEHQGKLRFPVGVGAIMTGITEPEARVANLYPLLEKPQVCYRDELLEWEELGDSRLIKRLEKFFTHRFKFWGLEEDQISTIRGIIHPEAKIREEPAQPTSVPVGQEVSPNAQRIRTLDHKQEQLARSLQSGHRLFCGVAGSGKTLILLSRAQILARGLFEKRVLLLCFNVTLASWLRSIIQQDDNRAYRERIEVMHFHEWAKSILGGLPNPQVYKENYDDLLGERLVKILEQMPLENKWDAVLIDEGHTFSPSWFSACRLALKDPEDGDLLIVSDRSQSFYNRQKFTWKSVGINAQGRMRKLNQNYRNTEEILSAAWEIIQPLCGNDDDETFPIVEPKSAIRRGKRPLLHLMDHRQAEVEGVLSQIHELVAQGYQPEDIAIIYRYLGQHEQDSFTYLTQQLEASELGCCWITKGDEEKRNYSAAQRGVRIVTVKSALGLEFKVVIVLWVQQFGAKVGVEDAVDAKRLLYVAMTRPQDILHLFGSGNFSFLEELQTCECLDIAS
ncbi:3'-5' exonuclease [Laspinema olomoucense]|uniref:NERD domain-containing protein n=1 Tax=Laspinema olomoucense D3b TaxID=2953688 RepID=A0ABT2ND43_9CYAN|nr:nuclease-related domain-containing DEAD/DEAH box helicase [Laspinema sp. D3b]MCT7979680.1 NERD domain-containing protein [Laspinema sp. D3b]